MIEQLTKEIKVILGSDYNFVPDGIEKDKYTIEHMDEDTHTIEVATVDFKNKLINTDTLQFVTLTLDQKRSLTRTLVYWLFEDKGDLDE